MVVEEEKKEKEKERKRKRDEELKTEATEAAVADVKSSEKKQISDSPVQVSADFSIEDRPPLIVNRSLSQADNNQVFSTRKKLLILDLNGLLVDIIKSRGNGRQDMMLSGKCVYERPFVRDFIDFCFERFEVAIWSSRLKRNIDPLVTFLFGHSERKLLFCWHLDQCTWTNYKTVGGNEKPLILKELKRVWEKLEPDLPWRDGEYNESNTLLLDDSPYKALRNPAYSSIFPYSYKSHMKGDSSLGPGGNLRVYLENLVPAENVQEHVRQNPFGQKPISESDPSWRYYEKILQELPPLPTPVKPQWVSLEDG